MTVATYNPSNLAMHTIELKVPHTNFIAKSFDGEQWQDAISSVICNQQQQELDPSSLVTNCNMFVTQTVLPGQISLTQVVYSETNTDTCSSDGDFIESADLSLQYLGVTDGAAVFNLLDKATGEINPVGFGLRYWRSFQEDDQ